MADRLARALCRARDGLLVPLAATASAFLRIEGWTDCGYRRQTDYAREELDRTSRWLYDHARLQKAMDAHPALRAALLGQDGKPPLGQVAALAVARVATPETLGRWIEQARTVSVRELVDGVRQFKVEKRQRAALPLTSNGSSPHSPDDDPPPDLAPNHDDPPPDVEPNNDDPPPDADPPPDVEQDDAEDGERCRVRIPAAQFVIGVFEELRDLFGAVNGRDVGPMGLIEACLAESTSSGVLPIVLEPGVFPSLPEGMTVMPLRVGPADAVEERALAHATGCWKKLKSWDEVELDERHEPREWQGWKLRQLAKDLLLRTFDVGLHAGQGDARALDEQFEQMTELEDEIERYLGQHLTYMSRRRAWRELGFANVAHYASERLGLRRSTAVKRSMLAAVLRRHVKLRKAYRKGWIGQEKSLLLHRVLVRGPISDEIEAAWVRWTMDVTVKRVRQEVRRLERSKLDAAAGPPKLLPWEKARARRRRKALRMRADCGDANLVAREQAGDSDTGDLPFPGAKLPAPEPLLPVSDQAWIESLYRAPGMGLERLERWSNFYIQEHTNEPLPRPTVFIDVRLPRAMAHDFVNAIQAWHGRVTAAALWLDLEGPKKPFDDPGVLGFMAVRAARLFTERSRRPPAWVGFLAFLENAFRAWDDPAMHSKHAAEETYRKAGWQCMAPGCTARGNLQNHHIEFGRGKRVNAPWNLICLCDFHHQRGIHGGLASVRGKAPLGLIFRIGRGKLAKYYVNERRVRKPSTAAA